MAYDFLDVYLEDVKEGKIMYHGFIERLDQLEQKIALIKALNEKNRLMEKLKISILNNGLSVGDMVIDNEYLDGIVTGFSLDKKETLIVHYVSVINGKAKNKKDNYFSVGKKQRECIL